MTELPILLRRLPYAFYTFAVLAGLWRIYNEISLVEATYAYADSVGPFEKARFVARSTAVYWGITEAAYLVSSGAFIHLLIAIFDKMKGPEA
ncbi:hypothetical protein [Erythrobacter rubeus]|uniref:Uncharacterized protein n=1 Tax=Erythrobacter rubeus TaxID=2760803 RepID=A0ABR8KQM7_9SPHN|nr:hypothetical protein [Erythrobacter rubeus]MBD2841702.1 hypothetical protein [Erythrobacter rubeus]